MQALDLMLFFIEFLKKLVELPCFPIVLWHTYIFVKHTKNVIPVK